MIWLKSGYLNDTVVPLLSSMICRYIHTIKAEWFELGVPVNLDEATSSVQRLMEVSSKTASIN